MHEPTDDPARLVFRSRNHARTVRPRSQLLWIAATLVAAVIFVLLIHALLERTPGAIGGSVTRTSAEMGDPDPSYGEEAYEPPATPMAQAEEGFYPATGMVYRCEGKGGAVSFQSEPCGPDARMTKAIHAPPERELPRRATGTAVAPSNAADASNAQYARVSQHNSASDSRAAACAQARRSREETLERVGLARTYDLLQRLDAMVNEACK